MNDSVLTNEIVISFAFGYAAAAHRGQTYGGVPYTEHLRATVDNVVFAYNSAQYPTTLPNRLGSILTAILHDVVEDTSVTIEDIQNSFGPDVRDAVDGVTDEYWENSTRAARKAATYGKTARNPTSRIVKLADRLANVQSGGKVDMYRKEHADFIA